jgi:hypothetical protein
MRVRVYSNLGDEVEGDERAEEPGADDNGDDTS